MLEPYLPRAQGALSPAEVAQLIQSGQIILIDTRAAEVFARAHLPGAVNFPLDTIEQRVVELNMLPAPGVLYCRGGKESAELAAKLAQQGLPIAYLEGGVLGWEAEGFKLVRP